MFSIVQIKTSNKRQEIVTNPWTNCNDLDDSHLCFGMYNDDKALVGFAAVQKKDLTACLFCFELEPFSNQAVLRDFFFKGILGILAAQGFFFLQTEKEGIALKKEFAFTDHCMIEELLKGSCCHDS